MSVDIAGFRILSNPAEWGFQSRTALQPVFVYLQELLCILHGPLCVSHCTSQPHRYRLCSGSRGLTLDFFELLQKHPQCLNLVEPSQALQNPYKLLNPETLNP